ncbi:aminoglycoside 6-adenylyltransferase [Chitinophagaceae bacterium LWZ2-11]
MIQQQFAEKIITIVKKDKSVIGLAVAGSWLTNEVDEFSDLDLILVTKDKVSDDKAKMVVYANTFGKLLTGFTGEHVGEPRLLICLYDDPLLHVDIKFLTLQEFDAGVEMPIILWDTENQLQTILANTTAAYPQPDHQWIEDRFWIWVHYAALKVGRGEYFEAIDFLSYLRMVVFGPLLHIKNGNLPRGVRKVETKLKAADFEFLKSTIATHDRSVIINALDNAITLYQNLRKDLFSKGVKLQTETEKKVLEYWEEIKSYEL